MACDTATLMQSAACLTCLTEQQLAAIQTYLLCQINEGGGSAGSVQNFAGSGPPTTQVPANGAGTYYDYTGQIVYHWNPITPGWE